MLNVAIIGTGSISRCHIEGYLAFPEKCKIVALCDIYVERCYEKIERFNLKDVKVYSDYKELLKDSSIQLISNCTPPYVHSEIVIDALNSGKHVLSEKPMAPTLIECEKMIEARDKSGKLLSIVAQNRFGENFYKLKQLTKSGKIGKILHAQVDSFWWRAHSYYDMWWRGTWKTEGGGCTLNHAVHHIDMLSWLMESSPKSVTSVISNVNHDNAEVEDLSVAILQYDSGAIAQITSSVVHHGEEQKIILQGQNARISSPFKVVSELGQSNGFPYDFIKNSALEEEITNDFNSIKPLEYGGHTAQIYDVITAIENGTIPLVSAEDGFRTIEIITAIYKSSFTKSTVQLPFDKSDEYYCGNGVINNAPHFYEKKVFAEKLGSEDIAVSGEVKKKV